jgi:hypothetical protein
MAQRTRNWNMDIKQEDPQDPLEELQLQQLVIKQNHWCPIALTELEKNGILSLLLELSNFTTHIH